MAAVMQTGVVVLLLLSVNALADDQLLTEPMRFETPKMNEEEQHSQHTPKSFEMQCDACTAIAYQLSKALSKAEAKRPSLKGKPLPESEYMDVIEKVCDDAWDDYGLKTVKGVNRLSGEGLEAKDVAGMMQGGGKWPGRLAQKCGQLVGDIGEDELYEEFRKRQHLQEFLCEEFTTDCAKSKKEEL